MKTSKVAILRDDNSVLRELARTMLIRNQERLFEEAIFTSATATSGTKTSCLNLNTIAEMKRKMEELGTFLPPTFYDGSCPDFSRGMLPLFGGLQFREMPYSKKQARTHRKKRINKKWRKRYGFIVDDSVDTGNAFLIQGHTMVAYPATFGRIMTVARNFRKGPTI